MSAATSLLRTQQLHKAGLLLRRAAALMAMHSGGPGFKRKMKCPGGPAVVVYCNEAGVLGCFQKANFAPLCLSLPGLYDELDAASVRCGFDEVAQ